MKIQYEKTDKLIPYESNAKIHPQSQIEQIAESIRRFGWQQPIVIDGSNVVIIGHGRLLAAKHLGIDEVPCVVASELSDAEVKALRLADNKVNESPWDFETLEAEIQNLDIDGIDMSQFGFDRLVEEFSIDYTDEYGDGKENQNNLEKRYVVPPFSVLDTRQGYWQKKKQAWLALTGDLSETRDGAFGKVSGGSTLMDKINGGTSNFDPVLAETMYKWFCKDGGKILDPFGGEQTKGVVAGALGYSYIGCEIRKEQCAINEKATSAYSGVQYVCGDSNEISQHIQDRDFDMLFTSPPYYDLEIYSKEDMSSLGTYEEFMCQYKNIFKQCYEMLADDSFAVIKVGEIRDKKTGEYRCFVADNVKLLSEIGFKFYNDIVLISPVGTAQFRANNAMRTRKVVKLHQNVLVFYKGNLEKISEKFPQIMFAEDEIEG